MDEKRFIMENSPPRNEWWRDPKFIKPACKKVMDEKALIAIKSVENLIKSQVEDVGGTFKLVECLNTLTCDPDYLITMNVKIRNYEKKMSFRVSQVSSNSEGDDCIIRVYMRDGTPVRVTSYDHRQNYFWMSFIDLIH
jgi:hypothetical protein